jgi:hypothetical protein
MQTNETAIRELEIPTLAEIWERVKHWAERVLTSEKKAEAALTAGTLVLMGYVAFVVCRALEDYTIASF